MTVNVLFAAGETRWEQYRAPLDEAFAEAGIDADLSLNHPPDTVDYIVFAPNGPIDDFTPYTRTKAVLNLWAGVEKIVGSRTLTQPLCRMVDSGLEEGMIEWVTGHVLRHHLGIDAHINGQDGVWRNGIIPPLARDRRVGVLGLGALGRACAEALAALRFDVAGWSRSQKDIPGIACHSGDDGLSAVLERAEILVLLMPLTPHTENVIDAGTLARMPRGAMIVNPARGPLIDDDALLAALDSGQIGHATLDVFRDEPLPPEHPYWAHPRVTVTPHIASETRPASAARVIAENVRRGEAGESFLFEVDRDAGY
ncbi:2-hydroxyacid dehydrogenase [Anianabacter salinae]|uniref:2-hydroxyacid dehydrogenase n=1 Tax=Anianabacter salinae TaxID=2851023 RepID=UPI00225DEC45|nr:glyoxylate/hydroxypyruvate reductase A [Anianabacter salinae]MBV0910976.1 glyoxylate/hydroxypyruvate reductase A [Anianabacter salinae]